MNRTARTAGLSLAASAAAHGVLVLFFGWALTVIPVVVLKKEEPPPPAPPKQRPADLAELDKAEAEEINFVDLLAKLQREKAAEAEKPKPPEEVPAIAVAAAKPRPGGFIASRDGQQEKKPLDRNTPIISDMDSRASATSAPEAGGDPSLPSQQGYDVPALSFTASDFADGGGNSESLPDTALTMPEKETAPAPLAPAPPEDPPPSVAQPAPARQPEPQEAVKTDDPLSPAPAPPKPPEIALRDSVLMENQIKLPREQATMPDTMRRQVPDPVPKKPAPDRPQPPMPVVDPLKTASARRGGQRSLSSAKTRVKGSLAVRGDEDHVDALATPEGKYAKAVRDVINPIWNARLAGVSGLAGTGVVEVEFDIDMQGRVSNARLLNPDGASAILNDVCLSAITGAKLPPPPEELRKEMADPLYRGKLRRRFSFYRL